MAHDFEEDYEICSCRRVSIGEVVDAIKNKKAKTLGDIQDITNAGTSCRHCIFPEGDFGKIKKRVYCIDILKEETNE